MDGQAALAGSIGKEEAAALWPHLTVESYRPGTKMFVEGVPSSHLYFVVSGSLTASVGASDGAVSLGIVGPGAWVGEIGFIDGGSATATIIAGERTTALRITQAEMMLPKDEHPRAAAVLMRTVTGQLADRLMRSTRGIVEEIADGQYRVREAKANESWLSNALGWLLGTKGNRS